MTIKEPLRHHSRTVTVIPHSGIQFLDFRINSKDPRIPRDWGCHDVVKKGVAPGASEFCLARRDEEPVQRETANLPIKYSLGPREVFEMVERRWIPIPLLRRCSSISRKISSIQSLSHSSPRYHITASSRFAREKTRPASASRCEGAR